MTILRYPCSTAGGLLFKGLKAVRKCIKPKLPNTKRNRSQWPISCIVKKQWICKHYKQFYNIIFYGILNQIYHQMIYNPTFSFSYRIRTSWVGLSVVGPYLRAFWTDSVCRGSPRIIIVIYLIFYDYDMGLITSFLRSYYACQNQPVNTFFMLYRKKNKHATNAPMPKSISPTYNTSNEAALPVSIVLIELHSFFTKCWIENYWKTSLKDSGLPILYLWSSIIDFTLEYLYLLPVQYHKVVKGNK